MTDLAFGSECGDAAALWRAAAALLSPEMDSLVRRELIKGDSFAAARQRAEQMFSKDINIQKYVDIYRSLIKSK